LAKTFSYLHDRRDPSQGQRLIETRLLVHGGDGWSGAAYVYDDEGTDASLQIAGDEIEASWIHDDGTMRTNHYIVPNANQCKECHEEQDNRTPPLGVKARHLNRPGSDGSGNQLQSLVDIGVLDDAPGPASWPRAANAMDPATGSLDQRARAWLDINCGHCHN